MDITNLIYSLSIATIAPSVLLFIKQLLDGKKSDKEQSELITEVERVTKKIKETKTNDILELMRLNVAELREYYTINKQQARNAFSSALFVCFLGFILFATGVLMSFFSNQNNNIIIYSTISGSIVELIAGLFFWLYSQSLKQINLFHESLRNTEKFLTAIQLTEKVSEINKDKVYTYVIQSIFDNDKSIEIQQ